MITSRRSRRGVGGGSGSGNVGVNSGDWNKPSLFVGVMIGMSVMAMMMRLRDNSAQIGTSLNDLMIAAQDNMNSVSTTDVVSSSRRKTNSIQLRQQHPAFDPKWDIYQQIEAEQTGRVVPPRTDAPLPERVVEFLDHSQLAEHDAFSASWFQTTENFLSMRLDGMGICEDAAFFAYSKDDRWNKLRMTADWLDFGIEHLSKWYTMMLPYENDIPFNTVMQKLEGYVQRGLQYPLPKEPPLKHTIAVIAFMAYENKFHPEKAHKMTTRNLAATIESLRRAGMGRVVVVGMGGERDEKLAQEAFQLVHKTIGSETSQNRNGAITQVGHMEVAFCHGKQEHAKTEHVQVNVPKATLMGLYDAMVASRDSGKKDGHVHNYLGDHSHDHWQYVYLTEPDSILNTRPSTLKTLEEYARKGSVIVPHRFQPMPHETDVRGCQKRELFLHQAGDFYNVYELDALALHPDKCCDEWGGPHAKPGLPPNFEDCGNFWYMCGFTMFLPKEKRVHDRLKPYKLIRLTQGTQFVLLASQEHGRRCQPEIAKNSNECARPPGK